MWLTPTIFQSLGLDEVGEISRGDQIPKSRGDQIPKLLIFLDISCIKDAEYLGI
jgi:hypothetical protein